MTLAIVLMGVGLLLVVAEVLVPSFGLLGGLATISIISSIVLAWQHDPGLGATFLLAAVLSVPLVVAFGFKVLPHTPIGKKLILGGAIDPDRAAVDHRDRGLEGQEGVALSPLRPSGVARIGGRRVDVVSRGERIEEGARVRVLEVRANRVVVTRAREEEPAGGPA